ncbi:MAG: hypothetical protein IJ659_07270 [Alloprevotella sp.]|nr:hypothetical protein [Alloprevotella sp.]
MNKDYQLEQLRRMLVNPELNSGLYLIDTDLSDEEIEECIRKDNLCRYIKGKLIPSTAGNIFELLIVGLSHLCTDNGIIALREQLFGAEDRKRETILYSLAIQIMKHLSDGEKTVIHVQGRVDLSYMEPEDLDKFEAALSCNGETVVVISVQKSSALPDRSCVLSKSLKERENYKYMENRLEKVHITYKHDKGHEEALNAILAGLKKGNIPFSIDKYDILYRSSIDEYEKEIGLADRVIMFVIPAYLKSLDCMFEMTEIFRNGHVRERTYPVVDLGRMKRNGDSLKKQKDFWQGEKVRKLEQMKTEPGGSEFVMQEAGKIDTIITTLDKFWQYICRDSTGKYDKLIENDAKLLIEELNKSLPRITAQIDGRFIPTTDTKPVGYRTTTQNGEKSVYVEQNKGTIIIN